MTHETDANKHPENATDDQHSDDSGFAASPEFDKKDESENERPTRLTLMRALSTPILNGSVKKFTVAPSQKGFMEKFIASRGKLVPPPQKVSQSPSPMNMNMNRNSNHQDSDMVSYNIPLEL
jgi:hypothetical protein